MGYTYSLGLYKLFSYYQCCDLRCGPFSILATQRMSAMWWWSVDPFVGVRIKEFHIPFCPSLLSTCVSTCDGCWHLRESLVTSVVWETDTKNYSGGDVVVSAVRETYV